MTTQATPDRVATTPGTESVTVAAGAEAISPAPEVVLDDLQVQLELLQPEERALLAAMISRSKTSADPDQQFDAVSFVHQYLKADPRYADFEVSEEEVAAAIAPPVVKEFADAPLIPLPTDFAPLNAPLDGLLRDRFSSHNFGSRPLSLQTVSTLLKNGYGVKRHVRAYNVRDYPFRVVPSAGGLQPIDLYLVVNDVSGLKQGLYYFEPIKHALRCLDEGNLRHKLMRCCVYQAWIAHAPLVFIMVCNMPRVVWKYHARGYRFVHVDTGVLTHNLYLVATALKLNTCAIAAYYDDLINGLVEVDGRNEFAILLFAVGGRPDRLLPGGMSGTTKENVFPHPPAERK